MAYNSTANPPFLMTPGPIASGQTTAYYGYGLKQWGYVSSDPLATVVGSSYFSNGYSLGMRKYDVVFHIDTASSLTSIYTVQAVTSTSGGVTCASQLTS